METLTARSVDCRACDRRGACTSIIEGVGATNAPLMVVLPAPSLAEGEARVPYVGNAADLVTGILAEAGSTRRNTYFTHATRCYDEHEPTPAEREACAVWLRQEILQINPLVILSLGSVATEAVLRIDTDAMHVALAHPGYILGHASAALRNEWEAHVRGAAQAAGLAKRPYHTQPPEPMAPRVVEPWYEIQPSIYGWPTDDLDYLAADTETDDLAEGLGVVRVCAQYSDGHAAMLVADPHHTTHLWLHHGKYDAPLLGLDLFDLGSWDDTMIMAYILRFDLVGLKSLGPRITGIPMEPITGLLKRTVTGPSLTPKGKPRITKATGQPKMVTKTVARSFSQALADEPERARRYALTDAVVTSRLARHLDVMLHAQPRLLHYYEQIEKPLVPILLEMEQRGLLVDVPALDEVHRTLTEEMSTAQSWLIGQLGEDVKLDSPIQLAKRLVEVGLPLNQRTPKGAVSVDRAALLAAVGADSPEEIPHDEHGDLVRHILDYRHGAKLRVTFCERIKDRIGPDGRIHPRFNQTATATSRLSSSEPNSQNIPSRTAAGAAIRKALAVAPDGYQIVKADFSQLELRVFAHYSDEPSLVEAYRDGRDVHQQTAADLYGVALDAVTPAQRKTAKNVNFLCLYGGSAQRLAVTGGVSLEAATELLTLVGQRFPSYAAWPRQVATMLGRDGYVETLYGWRNYYPRFWSPLAFERRAALREAANLPIQGTAAGIAKQLMIMMRRLTRDLYPDAHLILQVHDEVVYEVPEAQAPSFAQDLAAAGQQVGVGLLRVPLVLETSIGPSWGDTKGIDS